MNPNKLIARAAVKIALLAAIAAGVAGCNTVRGIGQDIERGGEAIQKAVK